MLLGAHGVLFSMARPSSAGENYRPISDSEINLLAQFMSNVGEGPRKNPVGQCRQVLSHGPTDRENVFVPIAASDAHPEVRRACLKDYDADRSSVPQPAVSRKRIGSFQDDMSLAQRPRTVAAHPASGRAQGGTAATILTKVDALTALRKARHEAAKRGLKGIVSPAVWMREKQDRPVLNSELREAGGLSDPDAIRERCREVVERALFGDDKSVVFPAQFLNCVLVLLPEYFRKKMRTKAVALCAQNDVLHYICRRYRKLRTAFDNFLMTGTSTDTSLNEVILRCELRAVLFDAPRYADINNALCNCICAVYLSDGGPLISVDERDLMEQLENLSHEYPPDIPLELLALDDLGFEDVSAPALSIGCVSSTQSFFCEDTGVGISDPAWWSDSMGDTI